eukprot:5388566-Amphidinium_carterae.1
MRRSCCTLWCRRSITAIHCFVTSSFRTDVARCHKTTASRTVHVHGIVFTIVAMPTMPFSGAVLCSIQLCFRYSRLQIAEPHAVGGMSMFGTAPRAGRIIAT